MINMSCLDYWKPCTKWGGGWCGSGLTFEPGGLSWLWTTRSDRVQGRSA